MKFPVDYLAELSRAVRLKLRCECRHTETVPVKEVFRGETAWEGKVEVFELSGHPEAPRAYAWGHYLDAVGTGIEATILLEKPPVVSPQTAVQVAIAAHARQAMPRRAGGS